MHLRYEQITQVPGKNLNTFRAGAYGTEDLRTYKDKVKGNHMDRLFFPCFTRQCA